MPDNQSIEVTGLFGFIPCFGVHILLADKGRFYIAHIPETAHLYVGYRVAVTGRREGLHVLEIESISPLKSRPWRALTPVCRQRDFQPIANQNKIGNIAGHRHRRGRGHGGRRRGNGCSQLIVRGNGNGWFCHRLC